MGQGVGFVAPTGHTATTVHHTGEAKASSAPSFLTLDHQDG